MVKPLVSSRAAALLLGGLVLSAAACNTLEVTVCGASGAICPPELECCGTTCVQPSCRNDTVDEGEECQTFGDRSCTEDRFDFGQVSCTSACTFDRSSCVRFGFAASSQAPCGPATATRLAAFDGTLWTSSPLAAVVGRQREGVCETLTLPSPPALLAGVSQHAAIAALAAPPGQRQRLYALTSGAPTEVVYEGIGGALGPPSARVVSASAAGGSLYVGRTESVLTTVTSDGSSWRARSRRVPCVAGESNELRGTIARGADLVVALVSSSSTRLGVVSNGRATDEVARNCTALPYRLAVVATVRAGGRDYLIGNATPLDAPPFVGVFEVGDHTQPTIPLGERLGASGTLGLAPLGSVIEAWVGPDDGLYVLGRRNDGSQALLVLRAQRWRELERGAEGRRIADAATDGGRVVALTDHGMVTSSGQGYELTHDFELRTDACADCQVRALARAGANEWTLTRNNLWRATENGVLRIVQLPPGPFTWEPHRLAVSRSDELPWFAAWRQSNLHALFLLRDGIRDTPATQVPILENWCGANGDVRGRAEALELTTSRAHAFVAVRLGTGAADCPTSFRVLARAQTSRTITELWRGDRAIAAFATPHDGSEVALAVLEDGPDGTASLWAFPATASTPATELVTGLPGHKLRAMWADTPTSGWLAGDEGLLLRFQDGEVSAAPQQQSVSWSLLHGTGPSDLILAATSGELRHYDGHRWNTITPPPDEATLSAVFATPDELYLGLGQRVYTLRVPRPAAKGATCELAE